MNYPESLQVLTSSSLFALGKLSQKVNNREKSEDRSNEYEPNSVVLKMLLDQLGYLISGDVPQRFVFRECSQATTLV